MAGFDLLRWVRRYNAAVRQSEYEWHDNRFREGIPIELWRSLPDSPDA